MEKKNEESNTSLNIAVGKITIKESSLNTSLEENGSCPKHFGGFNFNN
jgi:hypothetical protein